MLDSPIDLIDDDVLAEYYDDGSLERGRGYAAEDRVRIISAGPGSIDAACRGSGRNTYVVRVQWSERGRHVDLDDTCTCPLGGACKHCVAVLLTARDSSSSLPVAHGPATGDGHATTTRVVARWRSTLDGLGGSDDDEHLAPLALQVAVQQAKPSHHLPNPAPRLTMRPMRRSTTGRWVKTGASWNDLTYPSPWNRHPVDPVHRAAVAAIATSSQMRSYSSTNQSLALADLGPELWLLLERALDAGVELIGVEPTTSVELAATRVRPTVELTANDGGDVTVAAVVLVDDLRLGDGDPAGLLGGPAHGCWTIDDARLRLIPFTGPLHPSLVRLLVDGPVLVPARDVDELLDDYVPDLVLHAEVTSPDGSVTITTSHFEGLTLNVHRPSLEVAELEWSFRYRRGDSPIHHRVGDHRGRSRERSAETAALAELDLPTETLPALAAPEGSPRHGQLRGADLVTLLEEVVPALQASGVEVAVHGDQPALRRATEDPLVSLRVSDAATDGARPGGPDPDGPGPDGTDWFDLRVEVSVEGETIDFATLFSALTRGDETLILPSGTWLRLDQPGLARLRELIDEARGLAEPADDGEVRINRFQASWWEELAALGVVESQSKLWTDSVGQIAELTAPEPVVLPEGLAAELRPYQRDGLDWLAFLHRHRLGGILADDMGLGKTVQTLALCLHVRELDPAARFLVVAPTSVVDGWAREAERFAPGLRVRTISETAKRRGCSLADAIGDADLVVTSYTLFRLEHDEYAAHDWELLLLDEAQQVKNHQGKTYGHVRRLEAATKIAITGTPIENSLMDLWSLLSITAPGLYPDPARFSETYRKPIERGDAPELLTTLRRRVAPLMRRRTKEAVLTELPPKTEQTVEIQLSAKHARLYETQLQRQRQKVLGLVGDVTKHRFEILKSLTVLRQMALDPSLVDDAHDGIGSAKLDRLLEDLELIVAEGHRALVFSQFTRYLAKVRARLDDAGIDHAYLDGRTRRRDRAIARFKDGDAPVFVISLKAGGVGLNLTEADYCFVLDPWWNPATETQAVDRAHRIGQQNPVMVYRYVSAGTIEDKVMELKARKADLFASVMDADGALAGALSEDDIRGLLDLG